MVRRRNAGLAALVAFAVVAVAAGAARGAGAAGAPAAQVETRASAFRQASSALDAHTRALIAHALRSNAPTFVCSPASSSSNTASAQSCTITASKGVCIEVSTNPAVTQACTFTQTNSSQANVAVSLQLVTQRNAGQSGTESQSGAQTVSTQQGNATGPNVNWSAQIVKQFLGRGANNPDNEAALEAQAQARQQASGVPLDFTSLIQSLEPTEIAQENVNPAIASTPFGPAVTEIQQSQQTISVCQGPVVNPCASPTGMTGDNVNGDYQSLRQWEWANNAQSIDQEQNSSGGGCSDSASSSLNMCSVVHQNTSGGKNLSGVFELYRQFQRALNTSSGQQIQDGAFDQGGLGHDIVQLSLVPTPAVPQLETIITGQRARQVQRADNTGTLTQSQDPHVDKGPASMQTGSTSDTWHGWIDADQTQLTGGAFTSPGDQSQELSYTGFSTGDIVANVRGSENGSTASAQCLPGNTFDFCDANVSCSSVTPGAPITGAPSAGGCVGFNGEGAGIKRG